MKSYKKNCSQRLLIFLSVQSIKQIFFFCIVAIIGYINVWSRLILQEIALLFFLWNKKNILSCSNIYVCISLYCPSLPQKWKVIDPRHWEHSMNSHEICVLVATVMAAWHQRCQMPNKCLIYILYGKKNSGAKGILNFIIVFHLPEIGFP